MATDYHVAQLSHVGQQIKNLAAKAEQFQIQTAFLEELRATVERLAVRPKEVGDPIRRTALPGGRVYRVVVPPFIMHYAIYPNDRLGLILDLHPFPLSFPDE